MQNTYAIILAGGIGTRLSKDIPKQFLNLADKPVIIHTIEKFNLPEISGIIVVMAGEYISRINNLIKNYKIDNIIKVIKGGETRQASSYNALTCMDYKDDDILIFHDAARPFIDTNIIKMCIIVTSKHVASGVYVKATDTIAEVQNGSVKKIPDRDKLYFTQTPQAFKYRIIREAHELALKKGNENPTDDVQLVIKAGYKVKIIEGQYRNIKITSPFDLEMAEFIMQKEKERNKLNI